MLIWSVGVGMVLSEPAMAQFNPDLSVNWSSSDNFQRTATNRSDGTQTLVHAGVDYSLAKSSWELDARAAAEKVMYSGQDIDGGERYGLRLRSTFMLIPERITWDVLDDLGLIATDAFGALAPPDLQRVNVFTTGPNFFAPIGLSNRLEAELRFSRFDFSDATQDDGDTYSGTVGFLHQVSPIRNVGVVVSRQRIERGGGVSGLRDFNLDSASFALSSVPRRSALLLQVGISRVDDRNDARSRASAILSFERLTGEFSSLSIFARTGFADATDSFRFGNSGDETGALAPENVVVGSTPIRQDVAIVSINRRRGGTQISFSTAYSRERVRNDPAQSRRAYGVILDATRSLGHGMQLRLQGGATDTKYEDGVRDPLDINFSVGLTAQFSRFLSLSLEGSRYIRSETFRENRISATLQYSPFRRREGSLRTSSQMDRVRGLSGVATGGFRPVVADGK